MHAHDAQHIYVLRVWVTALPVGATACPVPCCAPDDDDHAVLAGTLYAADIMLLVHGALVTYSTRSSLSMMYN